MNKEEKHLIFSTALEKDVERRKGSISCPFIFPYDCEKFCGIIYPKLYNEGECPCDSGLLGLPEGIERQKKRRARTSYVRKKFWETYYKLKKEFEEDKCLI